MRHEGANMNNRHLTARSALSVAVVYILFGGLWILLSDKAVESMFHDPDILIRASILKGWFYVGATGLLLYFLVARLLDRLDASHQREIDNYREKQRAHDLLAAIADNSDDAIFAKDLKGRYLLFNPAASRLVGKPAAEVVGNDDRTLFPPQQAEMMMAANDRIIASGQIETNEEVLDTALGARTLLTATGPLRDTERRIVGIFGISRDITKVKHAEQALLESKKHLSLLVQNSPTALAMFDREMCYLAASDRWLTDLGLADGNIIGRSHYDVLPEIGAELKELHRRGLAGEAIRKDEDRFVRADGSVQWLRWEMRPWQEPDGGAIGGIVLYAEDITGRMTTEIALRESEHRFQDIVEATADWIWEVDVAGRYTYASDSVYRLLGYTPAELIGKTPFDLMPPEESERVGAEFSAFAARQAPFRNLASINIHKDGHRIYTSTNGIPILAADGALLGYRGLGQDVTEKKANEKALRDAHERLRTLIDTVPDLIWLKDTDGVYLTCNRRFETFFGAGEAEIAGKTDYDFVSRELADFFRARDKAAIEAGGALVNEEEVVFASDGHREILQTIKTPLRDSEGRVIGVLGVARDITASKLSEAALRNRNEELERFNRATVGREIDMIEMKKTINVLSQELGRARPYPLAFMENEDGKGAA